ncbi:MAG: hypothetical protein AAF960_08710 [Bacteroidota bacterium]
MQNNLGKLKQQLARQFLVNGARSHLTEAFEQCWLRTIDTYAEAPQTVIMEEKIIVQQFQKRWDQQLLEYLKSSDKAEKLVTDYYFHYFQQHPTVKKKLGRLQQQMPILSDNQRNTPFQDAFTKFITKIKIPNFTFSANADAFFLKIFNNQLADFKEGQWGRKAKQEPSKPNEWDLTNPTEADYLMGEQHFNPYKVSYLPFLQEALNYLDTMCLELLQLYHFDRWELQAIADRRGIRKQSVHHHLKKCEGKLVVLIKKMKEKYG